MTDPFLDALSNARRIMMPDGTFALLVGNKVMAVGLDGATGSRDYLATVLDAMRVGAAALIERQAAELAREEARRTEMGRRAQERGINYHEMLFLSTPEAQALSEEMDRWEPASAA